jgi:hypothetical protein
MISLTRGERLLTLLKFFMTLKLKYPITLTENIFEGMVWNINDEMLTFTNRMIKGFIIMRKYKFL